jgi:predicted nucleotidyltransferase
MAPEIKAIARIDTAEAADTVRLTGSAKTIDIVMQSARNFADEVRKVFPVVKAFLFGSWAKGTATNCSDVDICFFLSSYNGNIRADIIGELIGLTYNYWDVDIEPIVFLASATEDDEPFAKEVIRTGIEIFPGQD